MKKIFTLLMGGAMALSASALTIDDLTGHFAMNDAVGYTYYVTKKGNVNFGGDYGYAESVLPYLNNVTITTNGTYLYIENFLGNTFYAIPDLENMTVTVPAQEVTAPTLYTFTLCALDYAIYEDDFNEDTFVPQDFVMTINEDGSFGTDGKYMMFYGWGADYGYFKGTFTRTSAFQPDEATAAIAGAYTCDDFSGEWYWLWADSSDDSDWHTFNIATGEGISDIADAKEGSFDVYITATDGNNVIVNGLWWDELIINGQYDAATSTITFPLQEVWGGYTLCNSSFCDVEVPTEADIVPATAKVNEDGSISFFYTVIYSNYAYLWGIEQKIVKKNSGESGIGSMESDSNAPAEYYNLQGMRVEPVSGGLYIVRQGNKATKQVIR